MATTTPAQPPPPPPAAPAPQKKMNRLGLPLEHYTGSVSTLCSGCGHDSITNAVIRAFFDYGIEPHRVAKLSGIGCSSKTPAYFLGRSCGFNAVHGRMPAIATGAVLANRNLIAVGVSGDGDTASIGLGQFMHMVRRNVPCIYIIENNGVYGLTKGQFSATADEGSASKAGHVNDQPPMDCCALAINLGCAFVARSFSGDAKQMQAMFKAALAHRGTALLDIVSPCVTFNNHEGSTKSYKYAKDNDVPLHEIGFVPFFENIAVDYEPGSTKEVTMHDGSRVLLRKLDRDYDPTNRLASIQLLEEARTQKELLTGIFYINPKAPDFTEQLHLVAEPLYDLPVERVRPPKPVLDEIMKGYM
ncbi:MAG: 2-oxoacid:ferredoxin oxidoreductase subunit beta [Planctomycetes bacterium]|nr:2-oxoacid:ferredoxin oxidoreductase subunit beta [Planctomycetota bacterium]